MDRVAQDSRVHTTPILAELAERCDIIAVLQPSASDAAKVVAELAASVRAGTMLLDLSASHPTATRRLAAELSDRSVHLLDAALLGTEQAAHDGVLTFLTGGAEAVLAEVQPYFDRLVRFFAQALSEPGTPLAALLGAVAEAGPDAAGRLGRGGEERNRADAAGNDAGRPERVSRRRTALEIAASLGGEFGVTCPLMRLR